MRNPSVTRFAGLGLGVLLATYQPAGWTQAGAGSLEQRVDRLERMLRNQSISDLVLQMQRLQQEVRHLRGEVELQNHELEEMKRRQRDLYLDIDRRLSQGGAGPALEAGVDTPVAPVEAPDTSVPVAPPVAVPAGDPVKEEAEYQEAFELLKQQRYKESASAFRSFLARYPAGSYADNAQYWLAEASYVNRDFAGAMKEFQVVVERYPESIKVPDALLKIGFIHYEQKEWGKAREVLDDLIQRYPGTTAAKLAGTRLEKMRKEGR